MPSAEDNVQLLWLIVSQKFVDGQLTAVDWAPIASGLGLDRPQTAQVRWSRLKKELTDSQGVMPAKATPVKGAKKTAAPKGPRVKKEMDPNVTPKKRVSKKRKIAEVEKDEEEEIEEAVRNNDDEEVLSNNNVDETANNDDDEMDGQSSQEIEPQKENA